MSSTYKQYILSTMSHEDNVKCRQNCIANLRLLPIYGCFKQTPNNFTCFGSSRRSSLAKLASVDIILSTTICLSQHSMLQNVWLSKLHLHNQVSVSSTHIWYIFANLKVSERIIWLSLTFTQGGIRWCIYTHTRDFIYQLMHEKLLIELYIINLNWT